MFKERLLDALKLSQNEDEPNEETLQAMIKIQKQKKLSSQEFLKVYDVKRQEGPKTVYQNQNSWRRLGDTT
jgi:hypothetical protein